MTLYDIDSQIESIMNRMFESVDEETGEIDPKLAEELKTLNEARDQKLDNIGALIKNYTADVAAMKAEKDIFDKRIKQKQKRIDWLKHYVASDMISNNQMKFESARVVFSFRKSVSVSIPDQKIVPKKYFITKTETRLDIDGIGKLLKDGQKVRGASLIEKQNLQIK